MFTELYATECLGKNLTKSLEIQYLGVDVFVFREMLIDLFNNSVQ